MILDTCILIDILRKKAEAIAFITSLSQQPIVSVMSISELLAGIRTQKEKEQVLFFLESFHILEIDEAIAEKAGDILQKFQKSHGVEIGDALIAATALVHHKDLYTLNLKHFSSLDRVYRPY